MEPSTLLISNHTYDGSIEHSQALQSYRYDCSKQVTRYLPEQNLQQQSNETQQQICNNDGIEPRQCPTTTTHNNNHAVTPQLQTTPSATHNTSPSSTRNINKNGKRTVLRDKRKRKLESYTQKTKDTNENEENTQANDDEKLPIVI